MYLSQTVSGHVVRGVLVLMGLVIAFSGCSKKSMSEAVLEDDPAAVASQIRNGAEIDLVSDRGVTPLWDASMHGQAEIVQLLLRAGADANYVRPHDGFSPLHLASQNGHSEVVQMLLAAGANVNASDTLGVATPLHVAAQNGHEHIVQLLLGAGALVDKPVLGGVTALFGASQNGHSDIVALLLEAGANTAVNAIGYTPLSIAREKGHARVVEILEKHDQVH